MIKKIDQETDKAGVTVEQFASEIGVKPERLLDQFKDAGIKIAKTTDAVTEAQKKKLLNYLKKHHGANDGQPEKIVLRRAKTSELKLGKTHGVGKTVSIQVRKKRTYVKRKPVEEKPKAPEPEVQIKPDVAPAETIAEAAPIETPAIETPKIETPEIIEPPVVPEVAEEKAPAEKAKPAKPVVEEKPKPVVKHKESKSRDDDDKPKKKKKVRGGEGRKNKVENLLARGADVKSVLSDDDDDMGSSSYRKGGRSRSKTKVKVQAFTKPTEPVIREVQIPETIAVSDLAQRMSVKAVEVIKVLMKMGTMATINQVLDQDTAVLVVEEMGHTPRLLNKNAIEEELEKSLEIEGEGEARPPVITIMGHVDHGKTTLLDYIRTTKVAAGEAGGITQHIGAYNVQTSKGAVTFLDTPGHAAFTAMRARGAKLTDIVILIVAADDGVMPQTVEAIQHSKAAGVPIVVAVNKMDKPGVDPDRIKNELSKHELIPEEWGGDTMFVPISAKTGLGIDDLLDSVLLQAEMLNLTAVKDCSARGVVIESRLERGRGAVMSVLVQQGTLKKGDYILAGLEYGRIRAMFDEAGKATPSAGPSIPVEVLGMSGVPSAGDDFMVVADEKRAKEVAQHRNAKAREAKLARQTPKLEDLLQRIEDDKTTTTLNLLIKAGVLGSVEALRQALTELSNDEVKVNVISSGVGGINESDVNLAIASKAIILAFNVRANVEARKLMEANDVDVHYHNIIYDVINQVKKAMSGALAPDIQERIVGMAQVREVFRSSKTGAIAGCMVTEGVVKRNLPIRVLRDDVVIFEGSLESLRRFKDDANEVRSGMECGIAVKNYNDVKAGDQIEVYEKVEVKREIS